ncbi:MerR family transcriptional regulator [Saccharibacillus sp. CPCC 101409]|uniref:MerR family transcriptional regulator n=1 Tax=Saccharibacillus sp. CPCC 101409 TaxID=3058041 RepID=UPI0026716EA8|nr:MerR family transcriptional regulator [Saccharibacillus sp. CPCC 101409]MDO3412424.1 MerR family transcriptional regulator [Saccharibacillus sp. CPCC 101409]
MRYLIGEVAEKTGLSVPTLRYYEKEGIMPPVKRSESGLREYDDSDVDWLKFACCLRETGMTIAEMKTFASLTLEGAGTLDERLDRLQGQAERVQAQIHRLTGHLGMIEHKMSSLQENDPFAALTVVPKNDGLSE